VVKFPKIVRSTFDDYAHIQFFLHERDYVTFGSLLSQIRLSVYMSSLCLSVMSVHPTQRVERLAIFLHLCVLGHPLTSVQNFTEVVPRNPLSGR